MGWRKEARDERFRGWEARGQRQNVGESFGRCVRKGGEETLYVCERQGACIGSDAGDPDYPSRRRWLREERHELVCKEIVAKDIGAEDFR